MAFLSWKVRPFIWVGSGITLFTFSLVAPCGGAAMMVPTTSPLLSITLTVIAIFALVRGMAWMMAGCPTPQLEPAS